MRGLVSSRPGTGSTCSFVTRRVTNFDGRMATPRTENALSKDIAIRAEELSDTIAYLNGLIEILHGLDESGDGRREPSELLRKIEQMDRRGTVWEPLRYQPSVGQGWGFVAANVRDLRDRLQSKYAAASS